jgi:cyclase
MAIRPSGEEEPEMKRAWVLSVVVGLGALSWTVAGQAPGGPSAKSLDATKIEKVKDNLYIITGSGAADTTAFSGGNTAVFITDTGVTIVDTKLPGWGPTIVERVKSVTNKPITRIINTHTHGDHTGSNEHFGGTVETVVQENTLANMAKMDEFKGAKAKFLPGKTYQDKLTLGSGKDQIDLYHFGPAHTNGDTFVVFTALRTMHVGDTFAWKALPYIDPDNGGSVVQHPQTLTRVLDSVKNVDSVINGHIPVSTWADLRVFRDFNADFVAYAQRAMKAGKSAEQAAKEYTVPSRFTGYAANVNPDFGGPRPNMDIAYKELARR